MVLTLYMIQRHVSASVIMLVGLVVVMETPHGTHSLHDTVTCFSVRHHVGGVGGGGGDTTWYSLFT